MIGKCNPVGTVERRERGGKSGILVVDSILIDSVVVTVIDDDSIDGCFGRVERKEGAGSLIVSVLTI